MTGDGRRLIAQLDVMVPTAAIMFAGGPLVGLVEAAIPGGDPFPLLPGLGSFAFAFIVLVFGGRVPRMAMSVLGPIGVAMIALAIAMTQGRGDGAALYMWPVLWESYFFGRRGAIGIIVSVAVAHGLVMTSYPAGTDVIDRWVDVISAVAVVAGVVQMFSASRQRLLSQVAAEARIDELTGLLNRRGFYERASVELARARREQGSIGVVAFDLDHFKQVNDRFGHQVGDRVLAGFADCLFAQMRGTDVAGRTGGEEVVVLLPGADIAETVSFGERVRAALGEFADESASTVTVSGGATAAVAPGDIETLLRSADTALYSAKADGRNRIVALEKAAV